MPFGKVFPVTIHATRCPPRSIHTWMCWRLRSQKTMLAAFPRQSFGLQLGENTLSMFVR